MSAETLTQWTNLIKSAARVTQNTNSIDDDDDDDECESNADDEFATLEPVLAFIEWTTDQPPLANLAARLRQNPSPLTLTDLITEVIPLNAKQKTVSVDDFLSLDATSGEASSGERRPVSLIGR